MSQPLSPPPLSKVKLKEFDPRHVEGEWDKAKAKAEIKANTEACDALAHRLYAEQQRSVLLVLQGMDTCGKDGTIRKVTTGINPMSFRITAFKQPNVEELAHDFLWRVHEAAPRRGHIGIFNRSHYEDVVVVRVRELAPKPVWRTRYDRINEFEQLLVDEGVRTIKCFLHISEDEQRKRLEARLKDPTKRWKFRRGDLDERKRWDDYQAAYEDAITRCNTEHAPWHIVPSDRKWYRNLVVSNLLRETLEKLDPQFPEEEAGLDEIVVE